MTDLIESSMISGMAEIKILVVEDEPSLSEVVSLYLKRAGYQVQIAAYGRLAMTTDQFH